MRTDRKDMTKLKVSFCSFANASKKVKFETVGTDYSI
jgi:hypothetical protein